jgi:hypothetical protein
MPIRRDSGAMQMPLDTSSTQVPPNEMTPESGCNNPATQRNRDVFPEPDGPIRAKCSPGGTFNEIPASASTLSITKPKSLDNQSFIPCV